MSVMKRWKRRLRAVFRQTAVDREMDEELAFHLDLEIRKNEAAGMSPAEARRQAALTFGGVERFKEQVRDARLLSWVGGMSLDFKLGLRMLGRYPGLTIVGGLAVAFAVCIGAGTFEFMSQVFNPKLPLPEGDRVVGIRMWDTRIRRVEAHVLHDYVAWQKELRTVDIGAFRSTSRNLVTADGPGEPRGRRDYGVRSPHCGRRPAAGPAIDGG